MVIVETYELVNPEAYHALAAVTSYVLRGAKKLVRHALVHGLMPAVNFMSHRTYMQHRPDGYAARFDELAKLQHFWEKGRRGNNRGDYSRLYFLVSNVEELEKVGVPGAFAELGVFRGNSAKVLNYLAPKRELYLFDTFEGFPDKHAGGDPSGIGGRYAASLDDVRRFVGDGPNIVYCPGMFPETAAMVPEDTRFALVHLDCDLYEPTKAALEFFYPRMSPGGLMIFHDYNSGCWPGVRDAVDAFLADKAEGLVCIPDKSGTAALVKLHRPCFEE